MFGGHFYHGITTRAMGVFAALFADIGIVRGGDGERIKVPISYAPKRNYIDLLNRMDDGEEAERQVAMRLPRLTYEMTALAYNPQNQVVRLGKRIKRGGAMGSVGYVGTPYEMGLQLNAYAKTQDETWQILEQILPYFSPSYGLTWKPLPDIKEDLLITLSGVAMDDNFDGALQERRRIVATLDFIAKFHYYGPEAQSSLILDPITVERTFNGD